MNHAFRLALRYAMDLFPVPVALGEYPLVHDPEVALAQGEVSVVLNLVVFQLNIYFANFLLPKLTSFFLYKQKLIIFYIL